MYFLQFEFGCTPNSNGNNVSALRAQVRDIARQVAQFEERIKINDLLNEIRNDLRHRIQCIKTVLGEEEDEEVGDVAEAVAEGADDARRLLSSDAKDDDVTRMCSAEKFDGRRRRKHNATDFVKSGSGSGASKGDASSATGRGAGRMLTMNNKTPFWNEQSQVYQVIAIDIVDGLNFA